MKINYDKEADALYMKYTNSRVFVTKESGNSIIDYDKDGKVVGIEIIGVEELFKTNNIQIKEFNKKELECV